MDKKGFDDFSIDEILRDVKRMTGESSEEGKLWSLSEIDALLSDEKEQDTKTDEAKEEPAEKEPVFTPIVIEDETEQEISAPDFSEETADAILSAEAEESPIEQADEDEATDLKAYARANIIDRTGKIVIPEEADLGDESIEDIIKQFEPGYDEAKAKEAPKQEEESDEQVPEEIFEEEIPEAIEPEEKAVEPSEEILEEYKEYFENVEPLLDSVEQEDSESTEDELDLEKTKAVDVPGQISIEKTRIFNEVDTRATYDDSIDH